MTALEHRSLLAELAGELLLRDVAADFLAGAEIEDLAPDYGTAPWVLEDLLALAGFLPIGDMARRYWRREPVERIAASYGVSGRTLFRMLERSGIDRNGGTRKVLPLSPEEIARAYARERRELREIAAELGVSRHVVSRRLREAGIRVPVGRRPLDLPERDIVRRREGGETLAVLARTYATTAPTIRRRLQAARSKV